MLSFVASDPGRASVVTREVSSHDRGSNERSIAENSDEAALAQINEPSCPILLDLIWNGAKRNEIGLFSFIATVNLNLRSTFMDYFIRII